MKNKTKNKKKTQISIEYNTPENPIILDMNEGIRIIKNKINPKNKM